MGNVQQKREERIIEKCMDKDIWFVEYRINCIFKKAILKQI